MHVEHEPPKTFLQKLQERAAASRFFTVSLVLHMALIIIGGSVVLFKQMVDPPDFSAGGDGLVSEATADQAPGEQAPEVEQQLTPVTPNLNTPDLSTITSKVATPTFTVASAAPVMASMPSDAMAKATANVGAKGLSGLPGAMGGRAGGTAQKAARQKNGGKEEGELAILRGLRWLVKTQKDDGSWSDQHKTAMTGLALLAFLGHGETQISPEFGPTVGKAIDWMLDLGKKHNGKLADGGSISQPGSYTHGIATYALAEYYAMTKDENAAAVVKKAVKHIVDGQGPDGGWMYSFDKSMSDTSVTGWQIQALKAAYLAGLAEDGVDDALEKAMANLKRVQGPNGGFGYRKSEDRYSLTGVGILCTYLREGKSKSVTEGMKFLSSQIEKHPVEYQHATADLYAWYYNTQACFMYGEPAWSKWNRMFQDPLIKAQASDGSWPPMAAAAHGALQNAEAGAGPFYRTTLCILMLEVYYRYDSTTLGSAKKAGKLGSSLDRKP